MALPGNVRDREHQAFKENADDLGVDKRVCVTNGAGNPIPVSLSDVVGDTTVTMFNITLGTVDTEQSQALPANTKGFVLKTRGTATLKISYTVAESGTKYMTIPSTGVYTDDSLYVGQTIYFQSPETSDVVEMIVYVQV